MLKARGHRQSGCVPCRGDDIVLWRRGGEVNDVGVFRGKFTLTTHLPFCSTSLSSI